MDVYIILLSVCGLGFLIMAGLTIELIRKVFRR